MLFYLSISVFNFLVSEYDVWFYLLIIFLKLVLLRRKVFLRILNLFMESDDGVRETGRSEEDYGGGVLRIGVMVLEFRISIGN